MQLIYLGEVEDQSQNCKYYKILNACKFARTLKDSAVTTSSRQYDKNALIKYNYLRAANARSCVVVLTHYAGFSFLNPTCTSRL